MIKLSSSNITHISNAYCYRSSVQGLLNVSVSVAYMDAGHGAWTLTYPTTHGRAVGLTVHKQDRLVK